MVRELFAGIFSPWDQLPLVAAIALVFIYTATAGEAPPLPFRAPLEGGRYMAPENLWREAIVIGGFTWGLLWWMCASLFVFAKDEALGAISMLEPIRGMLPTGSMAIFFGLLASIDRGRAWIVIGLGLFVACTLSGLVIAIKRLPLLSPLGGPGADFPAAGKWLFGIFYFCSEDFRILAPRRRGGGLALNLAHGRAWGVLAVGMALPLGLAAAASFSGLL